MVVLFVISSIFIFTVLFFPLFVVSLLFVVAVNQVLYVLILLLEFFLDFNVDKL